MFAQLGSRRVATMKEPRLLSVGDVARRFGVSSAAVVAMERSGKLRALRTEGGMRLFTREDVEQLAVIRQHKADLKGNMTDERNSK
jgi:excisionase family DNA binding protein